MNDSAKDGQLVNFVGIQRTSGSPANGNFLKISKSTEFFKTSHTTCCSTVYTTKNNVHTVGNLCFLATCKLSVLPIAGSASQYSCQFCLGLRYCVTTVIVAKHSDALNDLYKHSDFLNPRINTANF